MNVYSLRSKGDYLVDGFAEPDICGPFPGDEQMVHERDRLTWQLTLKHWANRRIGDGLHFSEGSQWPDVLRSMFFPPLPRLLYSKVVQEILTDCGANLVTVAHVPIGSIESETLRAQEPPEYFAIKAPEGIEMAWEEMGFLVDGAGFQDGIEGGVTIERLNNPPDENVLTKSTWSGEPVFTCSNWTRGDVLVVEEVKEALEKANLRNLAFKKYEVI